MHAYNNNQRRAYERHVAATILPSKILLLQDFKRTTKNWLDKNQITGQGAIIDGLVGDRD